MQRSWRTRVVVAIGKPVVALAHLRVGNERRDLEGRERREIRFTMVAYVRREHRRTRAHRRVGLHDRQQ